MMDKSFSKILEEIYQNYLAHSWLRILVGLSVVVCALFVLYLSSVVYGALNNYQIQSAELRSVPLLTRQIAHLEQQHHRVSVELEQLNVLPELELLHATDGWAEGRLDLHRLAQTHRLQLIALDRLNEPEELRPSSPELSVVNSFSLKLEGHFFDYVSFRKALSARLGLVQIEREYLSHNPRGKLDILMELRIYRSNKPSA